jgi:hypothetical protein
LGILNKPLALPSVHLGKDKGVEAEMGIKMTTFAAPTLSFVDEPPKTNVKPEAVRVYPYCGPDIGLSEWRHNVWVKLNDGLAS